MQEVYEGRRFVQYGISTVKLAAMRNKGVKAEKGTKKNPIVKDGCRYIYGEEGRLVPLEHYDPKTMLIFVLTKDTELDRKQIERMREFSMKPVEPDEECPELTDDQIEQILQKAREQRKDS